MSPRPSACLAWAVVCCDGASIRSGRRIGGLAGYSDTPSRRAPGLPARRPSAPGQGLLRVLEKPAACIAPDRGRGQARGDLAGVSAELMLLARFEAGGDSSDPWFMPRPSTACSDIGEAAACVPVVRPQCGCGGAGVAGRSGVVAVAAARRSGRTGTAKAAPPEGGGGQQHLAHEISPSLVRMRACPVRHTVIMNGVPGRVPALRGRENLLQAGRSDAGREVRCGRAP